MKGSACVIITHEFLYREGGLKSKISLMRKKISLTLLDENIFDFIREKEKKCLAMFKDVGSSNPAESTFIWAQHFVEPKNTRSDSLVKPCIFELSV